MESHRRLGEVRDVHDNNEDDGDGDGDGDGDEDDVDDGDDDKEEKGDVFNTNGVWLLGEGNCFENDNNE
jgi:hypothetical protein